MHDAVALANVTGFMLFATMLKQFVIGVVGASTEFAFGMALEGGIVGIALLHVTLQRLLRVKRVLVRENLFMRQAYIAICYFK